MPRDPLPDLDDMFCHNVPEYDDRTDPIVTTLAAPMGFDEGADASRLLSIQFGGLVCPRCEVYYASPAEYCPRCDDKLMPPMTKFSRTKWKW
jgi:hypothetical protein